MLGSDYFDKQTEDKLLPVNVVDAQIHILRLTRYFSIAFYEILLSLDSPSPQVAVDNFNQHQWS